MNGCARTHRSQDHETFTRSRTVGYYDKDQCKMKIYGGLHTLHGTYPCAIASAELENQISFDGLILFSPLTVRIVVFIGFY